MLTSLIHWSLLHRYWVLAGAFAVGVAGVLSLRALNIDAFPDTTPVQVQINTTATALVPEEVERQITFPVELAMNGLPRLEHVRSVSQFGLSQVVVTFKDGTDIYFARQLINERLSSVQMPDGIERPSMGPVSTGMGEVFHYIIDSDRRDLTELRTLHDWDIKPALRTTPGIAEINSWGGFEKQYQVRINPAQLIKHDLSFEQVVKAVAENNLNVGGGSIHRNRSGEMLLVHGIGRTMNLDQIENIVITAKDGVPIRVRDVAEVAIGHEIRRGLVTAQGQGEVVLGLGFMLMGENSYSVTHRLGDRMAEVKQTLPDDVQVQVVYDRTQLVDQVIETVRNNLLDAAVLVVIVLFIFLANIRAGLIVAIAIPMSMLFAFNGMWAAGIAGTLLSLGAIDFGVVVESSVVLIENLVRRLAHADDPIGHRNRIVRDAAVEVRQPCAFGQLIIMIVYIPLLTLEGVEGKMFRPMAWTLIFVLSGSLLCSLTLMPVLGNMFLQKKIVEREPWLVRVAQWLYRPVLNAALSMPLAAVGLGIASLVLAVCLALNMGTEFVPRLSEGAIVIGIVRAPGTDLDESVRLNQLMERTLLRGFPDEIEHIWCRTGSPEVATDPGGVESTDVFITLTPREQWKRAKTQDQIVEQMEREISHIPGQITWFTQPIEQRINEMISGVRADIALKLFGDDLETLITKSRELEATLRHIPGCADLSTEQVSGQPILQVRIRQDQIARYGIPARSVLDLVESVGGKSLGTVVEGQLRFPLVVRLPERHRQNPEAIAALTVATPSGELIPLSRLAEIRVILGPKSVSREWSQRRISITCNVRGRDIGTFVSEAQRKIAESVKLPEGYRISWGGQFENMQRAQLRLSIVVPLALGLILVLLYLTYRNIIDTIYVFTSVPFACVGGLLALWYRGMPISISASVGFITLAGVSVLNSMVLVTAIRDLQSQGLPNREAITEAAVDRLRTRMMTALVAIFGFLPMATSVSAGAEVQRPLATVVIGGVISSTIMMLIVLPVLYLPVPPLRRHTPRRRATDLPHHSPASNTEASLPC